MNNFYIIICMSLLVASCNEDKMNKKAITVQGCITDNIDKTPIAGAKVTILCWYHTGWDETNYISVDTISAKNGCFSANFDKGYKVIVASVATKYSPNLTGSEELNDNNVRINLELKKRKDTTDTNAIKINLRYFIVENSSN